MGSGRNGNNGSRLCPVPCSVDVLVGCKHIQTSLFVQGELQQHPLERRPVSSRLVSASDNYTAVVWDITTRERVQTLRHGYKVLAAKCSLQGDRIATATHNSVRVYDSSDGHLLVDIKTAVNQWYDTGLVWFNGHLLVVSGGAIRQFKGSPVSEWPVPDSDYFSCIALPIHRKFIVYSAERTVTFWDMTTHTPLDFIQHPEHIRSIALSPDDLLLAIGGLNGKMIIKSLSRITVRSLYCWITVCLNNFTAKFHWHTMLGIYSQAKTTRRAAFDSGRSRQQPT